MSVARIYPNEFVGKQGVRSIRSHTQCYVCRVDLMFTEPVRQVSVTVWFAFRRTENVDVINWRGESLSRHNSCLLICMSMFRHQIVHMNASFSEAPFR